MLPEIHLKSVRPLVRDEQHNAFTDITLFQENLYLAFRSCPEGHGVSPKACVRVLRSRDNGANWDETHQFSVAGRDTRDPHFLVFEEKLFVYSGTWGGQREAPNEIGTWRDLNEHCGYCTDTADGENWSELRELESTQGHYIWRAAAYEGKAYLCGRRKSGFTSLPSEQSEWAIEESVMLASDDGYIFGDAGLFQTTYGDETAFVFDDKGAVTALARCRDKEQPGLICRSEPPYEEWERAAIDRNIGGPMLSRWGNFLIAGGRRSITEDDPTCVLYWLEDDRLEEALELPSGGDCSYPGFVEIDAQHALVSYYSSHEGGGTPLYPASIYLAEIELDLGA